MDENKEEENPENERNDLITEPKWHFSKGWLIFFVVIISLMAICLAVIYYFQN